MTDILSKAIIQRLDVIIGLKMQAKRKDGQKLNDQIGFLDSFELPAEDSARILGTTKRTVTVLKSAMKLKSTKR